jgi:hypothetical protein
VVSVTNVEIWRTSCRASLKTRGRSSVRSRLEVATHDFHDLAIERKLLEQRVSSPLPGHATRSLNFFHPIIRNRHDTVVFVDGTDSGNSPTRLYQNHASFASITACLYQASCVIRDTYLSVCCMHPEKDEAATTDTGQNPTMSCASVTKLTPVGVGTNLHELFRACGEVWWTKLTFLHFIPSLKE